MSTPKIHSTQVFFEGLLEVRIFKSSAELAACAAEHARVAIADAIGRFGNARLTVATGASQFDFFKALVEEDIDWNKVDIFHLDEYIGMPGDHPASFRRYLRERFVDLVHPREFFTIRGEAPDPAEECRRYAALLSEREIDVCVCGIGENGHLAFNDPPVADFSDPVRLKVVELDEPCRRQQFGEGWFASLDEVPRLALTQTIPSLLAARLVLCVVPELRKAPAVHATLRGPIVTSCPASIMRSKRHAVLYLDAESASKLD
jgi:glucosamine-6-phosphate deaminase